MMNLHTSNAALATNYLLPSFVVAFEYAPSLGASDARIAALSWSADCGPDVPRTHCENCRQHDADWMEWMDELWAAECENAG